jgi:hypothetical protein
VNIEDKAFVTGMRPDTGHDTKPDIRIDKEGVWYYRGTVMFRKDIVQSLYQHLKRDPDGGYHIEIGEDRADVDVEDTPYVVKSVSCIFMDGKGKDVINLHMPDDSMDELDPSTLRVGADNALYGIMARVGIEARFSRSSYYQLAEHIEFEAGLDKFYISLNGHRYYIR